MKKLIWLLSPALMIAWFITTKANANPIVGGLYLKECSGGWCSSSYQWASVITDQGVLKVINAPGASYQPVYEKHAFFPDGRSVLLASESDCYNDNSFEECLVVALLDQAGNLIKEKTFMSTYRQTNPNSTITEQSMFDVADVTTWNNRIIIAFNLPPNTIAVLDDNLNIIEQIQVPTAIDALAGPWVILNDKSVLDLETGKVYKDPLADYAPRHSATEAVATDDGFVLFYSAPTGLYLELYGLAAMVKRTSDGLETTKVVRLDFNGNGTLSGAPYIMQAEKNDSGWTLHIKTWKNFGGDEEHGVVVADHDWNSFKAYIVRGANKRDWENFSMDQMGELSDHDGHLFFPLSIPSHNVALVNIKALPLKQDSGMSTLQLGGNRAWEPVEDAQLQTVSYLTECSDCINFIYEPLDATIGIVQQPTLFFSSTNSSDDFLLANFFCYGPTGYKTYCAVALGGHILIYNYATSALVPFDPARIDEYKGVDNEDVPETVLQVPLCNGAQPAIPPLSVQLIALSVPKDMNLSTALNTGDYILSIVPWKTPECSR